MRARPAGRTAASYGPISMRAAPASEGNLDGGAETTRTVIAHTILNLFENPAELEKLRNGADMTVAVEEFIREVEAGTFPDDDHSYD